MILQFWTTGLILKTLMDGDKRIEVRNFDFTTKDEDDITPASLVFRDIDHPEYFLEIGVITKSYITTSDFLANPSLLYASCAESFLRRYLNPYGVAVVYFLGPVIGAGMGDHVEGE